jgi:hypothetical protein
MGLKEVDEVEAEGLLDAGQEPMPDEAGEFSPSFPRVALRHSLKERELRPVRLTQIDEPKPAKSSDRDRLGRDGKKPMTNLCYSRVSAKSGDSVVVFVGRDTAVDEPAFEKAGQEIAKENVRLDRSAHALETGVGLDEQLQCVDRLSRSDLLRDASCERFLGGLRGDRLLVSM